MRAIFFTLLSCCVGRALRRDSFSLEISPGCTVEETLCSISKICNTTTLQEISRETRTRVDGTACGISSLGGVCRGGECERVTSDTQTSTKQSVCQVGDGFCTAFELCERELEEGKELVSRSQSMSNNGASCWLGRGFCFDGICKDEATSTSTASPELPEDRVWDCADQPCQEPCWYNIPTASAYVFGECRLGKCSRGSVSDCDTEGGAATTSNTTAIQFITNCSELQCGAPCVSVDSGGARVSGLCDSSGQCEFDSLVSNDSSFCNGNPSTCCMELRAECLACVAKQTVRFWCSSRQDFGNCPDILAQQ